MNPLKPEFIIVIFHYNWMNSRCNSRVIVDENDLEWVTDDKKILLLINSSKNIFVLKPIYCRKLSHFSEMQNGALMHQEALKG